MKRSTHRVFVFPQSGRKDRRIAKNVEMLTGRAANDPLISAEKTWRTVRAHTVVYDGWNLVAERIVQTNGTSETFQYVWGKDLSGTLQGAGGVGGLLWLKRNGIPYIPCYDNNGNVVTYLNGSGTVVASFVYDAFGKTVSQSGSLSDAFRHRFSTKYYDDETGLYYYGYRFYSPSLSRWLNRDPIEEDGGNNLYAFCANAPSFLYDKNGYAYFAYRPLKASRWIGIFGTRKDDYDNTYVAHENLFFEDNKEPRNLGYFADGLHPDPDNFGYSPAHISGFNDCIMRKAVRKLRPLPYDLLGSYQRIKYNCQDWAEEVRMMYFAIKNRTVFYSSSTMFIGGR